MTRKKNTNRRVNAKDQIGLAMKALDTPSSRAEFLFNTSRYGKKEKVQLDPKWIRIIEEEVNKINKQLLDIEGRFYRKIEEDGE